MYGAALQAQLGTPRENDLHDHVSTIFCAKKTAIKRWCGAAGSSFELEAIFWRGGGTTVYLSATNARRREPDLLALGACVVIFLIDHMVPGGDRCADGPSCCQCMRTLEIGVESSRSRCAAFFFVANIFSQQEEMRSRHVGDNDAVRVCFSLLLMML